MELIDLLDLEEIEIGLFRARQPDTQLQRVFGGQVLAQALIAAARTVSVSRVLHSLHAYFLVPGRTDIPMVYDVESATRRRLVLIAASCCPTRWPGDLLLVELFP
jgi:acyl-CoA thioesterase II